MALITKVPIAVELGSLAQSIKHDVAFKKHITVISILSHKSIMCIECPYCTQQKRLLEQHVKAVHIKVKDIICSECKSASS